MNNHLILFIIFISFLSLNIYSKRCSKCNTCLNDLDSFTQKNSNSISQAQYKDNLQYYQKDKTITTTFDKLKLKMNFNSIHQTESDNPDPNFKVNYILNFYDKEKLDIDEINAVLEREKPLYKREYVKKGNETKGSINWEVDIEKNEQKEQIAQLIANASLGDNNNEIYIYNSFRFTYKENKEEEEKKKEDNTFGFMLIFFCYLGCIIITFGAMYVYFYATIEIGRNTLVQYNISAGFNDSISSQDRDSKQDVSRTTA
jgi:hypothetical protein